jgi:hypothetical protein
MRGLTHRVHSMTREEDNATLCEEEAALGWHRRRRKSEAGGAGWAKTLSGLAGCSADWAGS